ncbi:MAG TPA: alpha/beta hydrolase [Nitriliruptorales bacterium]|nr:alpha/beta hydrolase [Nitriliruptorales bacterium]
MVTIAYGPEPTQQLDLLVPDGDGPSPVVVLVHGGFWMARYDRTLMAPLADDLAQRGYAAVNVEYRRGSIPGGGWPGTLQDVAHAFDHLASVAEEHDLDLRRLVAIGHSAGGQLAMWAAARRGLPGGAPGAHPLVTPRAVVSVAGLLDLHAAAVDGVGGGAARRFLGGGPDAVPERYALASPVARLPLGVHAVLIHGDHDEMVPPSQSRRFADAALAAGDQVELVVLPGVGHFAVLDRSSPTWQAVTDRLAGLTRRAAP